MRVRWAIGALAAVIVAVLTATASAGGRDWSVRLAMSPLSVELSASDQPMRIVLTI